MTFLSIIITIVLVFYIAGWIGRLLLRSWINRKQRQFSEQFGDEAGGYTYKQYTWGGKGANSGRAQNKKDGEVTVEKTREVHRKINRDIGDYVEYEEVKECETEETGS